MWRWRYGCFSILLFVALRPALLGAQEGDVTLHLHMSGTPAPLAKDAVWVVWLTPLDTAVAAPTETRTFRMVQKSKSFQPHLLVVPVGSTVSFPNLDPFFHNVFSLFNGVRFDLGLYQTGRSQSVTIAREGVSYIFCNIHPEMAGVIVSLRTPYYAVTSQSEIHLHGVPPGTYQLSVWSEHATTDSMREAGRMVAVHESATDLGTLTLQSMPQLNHVHPNKFGEAYGPPNP